jgi:hypothetical protein
MDDAPRHPPIDSKQHPTKRLAVTAALQIPNIVLHAFIPSGACLWLPSGCGVLHVCMHIHAVGRTNLWQRRGRAEFIVSLIFHLVSENPWIRLRKDYGGSNSHEF